MLERFSATLEKRAEAGSEAAIEVAEQGYHCTACGYLRRMHELHQTWLRVGIKKRGACKSMLLTDATFPVRLSIFTSD